MSGRAIIVGGAGAVGRAVVSRFAGSGWHTVSIDFAPNDDAASSLQLCDKTPWTEQAAALGARLGEEEPADLVFCGLSVWIHPSERLHDADCCIDECIAATLHVILPK